MSVFPGRWSGHSLGNSLRPATRANETNQVKNHGSRHSWEGDASGVSDRWCRFGQWLVPENARYLERLASFSRLIVTDRKGATDRRHLYRVVG
jgi:hypothetical protein